MFDLVHMSGHLVIGGWQVDLTGRGHLCHVGGQMGDSLLWLQPLLINYVSDQLTLKLFTVNLEKQPCLDCGLNSRFCTTSLLWGGRGVALKYRVNMLFIHIPTILHTSLDLTTTTVGRWAEVEGRTLLSTCCLRVWKSTPSRSLEEADFWESLSLLPWAAFCNHIHSR